MKQAWNGAVYIQTAFILVDLGVSTSVACLFELWKQFQDFVSQEIKTNCVTA